MKTLKELTDKMNSLVEDKANYKYKICICGGTSCSSSASIEVYNELLKELKKTGLDKKIIVVKTGCHGLCAKGPVMTIYPDNITYQKLESNQIEEIVEEHFINKNPLQKFMYMAADEKAPFHMAPVQIGSFSQLQKKNVFRNCGMIDPQKIEDYIEVSGYQALGKALTELEPEEIIKILVDSELRGRGGAGFLTGIKWKMAYYEKAENKYVICNADEGDLGAYMDRSILESDPHSVIEAMAIAGYTIGASQGYIYIRPEYTVAVANLKIAIKQAEENGLIGKNILGTKFSFNINLRFGAGAYVCGEETALMNSFIMNRGEPDQKLIYPTEEGLFESPTIINNVETMANIPQIILKGAEWFSSIGNSTAKGTKIFALGGSINNAGLVEVQMGTTLRTLVYEIGGGISNRKKFKAAQTGGASGGYIPEKCLDMEMDFDKLAKSGTLLGAGGIMVLDEDVCIVDNTKYQVEFSMKESCGKCTSCRIGVKRMYELLVKICDGKAEKADLDKLEDLAKYIKNNALCGLGKAAANPVLSSLRYFRDEYEAHVIEKRCPAGVCKELVKFTVNEELCEGCGVCAASCPKLCISERQNETKLVDNDACIACGTCYELCPVSAIYKE